MNYRLKKYLSFLILFFFMLNNFFDLSIINSIKAFASEQKLDISINFQPQGSNSAGYIPDTGDVYGERNGYLYGWNSSHHDNAYVRNTNSDSTLDTLINMKPDGKWEIALPNGEYDVELSVGDSVYSTNLTNNSLNIENVSFFSNISLQENEFKNTTKKVTVTDGKLTLCQGGPNKSVVPLDYIHIVSSEENNPYAIKLEMYNGNTSDPNNTLFPRFRLSNIGTTNINLSDVKIEYYFTNDNGKQLNYWCDWSTVGSDKITGSFIQNSLSEKSDTNFEIGFNKVGSLAAGQNIELHTRIAASDWTNMNQSNDYSFNSTDSSYAAWEKAVVYINGSKVWGITPDEATTIPTPTPTTGNTPSPSATPTPNVVKSKLKLQMFNQSTADFDKQIDPRFNLINTSNEDINMKDIKIRYYYFVGGDTPQNFWCDWSSVGTGKVTGTFVKMPVAMAGADYYVELTFDENTGILKKGDSEDIKTRFSRTNWVEYNQTDDYSFNSSHDNKFMDWTKATVYIGNDLVWGQEPSTPLQVSQTAKVQMYNKHRNDSWNTIQPFFKLYNAGNVQYDLSDVTIRYYYTKEGTQDENFWCDWSSIGSSNITHKFVTLPEAFSNEKVKNFVDIGFTSEAGKIIAGDSLEIQTRVSKDDWSDYTQSNDYSFDANDTKYVDWNKVSVYIKGKLVWGNGVIAQTPSKIVSQATENTVSLSWEDIYAAKSYEVEADGIVKSCGTSTNFMDVDLKPGTEHKYRIRAVSDVNAGDWSKTVDIWTVPGITQNISAVSTNSSIIVSWEPIEGVTSYEIEVEGMPVDVGLNTSYTHEGLGPNTQRVYRVRGINSSGKGKWSEIISKSTLPGSSFGISTSADSQSVTLFWDKASGATGYDLEIDGVILSDLKECKYIHENLSPSTEHTYRIRPKNADGVGDWTELVKIYTLPETPTGLNAVSDGDSITVTWNEAKGAKTYEIEVDGAVIDNGSETSYVYSGLLNNSAHVFRVRGVFNGVTSLWSNTVSTATLPAVPANGKADIIGSNIELSWDMVEGAIFYEVDVNGSIMSNIKSNKYTVENVTPNTKYVFKVRAVGNAGASEWCSPIESKSLIGVPQGVTVIAADDSMSLNWQDVAGATGYEVLADGKTQDVTSYTYFVHKGLEPNTLHVYRIRAVCGSEAGEWTEPILKYTVQGVPGNLRGKLVNDSILVMWDAVNGATSYEINADGSIIDTSGNCYYFHEELRPNTEHKYSVRSKKDGVVSPWSSEIKIKTPPGIPQNLRASATTNEIKLSWDSVSGASGYDIEIDGTVLNDVTSTAEYLYTGLEPNTKHSFRVRARNDSSVSELSELLQKNTNPILEVEASKDSYFNFVFVIPANYNANPKTITVQYNADELEAVDLCAVTPTYEIKVGKIEGTSISVVSYAPGRIVYQITDTYKTQVNSIKFMAKVNGYSKVVYEVK